MGLFIIALAIVIALQIRERNSIAQFIVGIFGMFTITLILTGLLNICLLWAPQTPHLITSTKTPLRSFEHNCFLVNTGDHLNYIIDTEAGIEMKSEEIGNTVVHFTEGEPCVYGQYYTFDNPVLDFMVFNMHTKKAFYVPEDTTMANYYMNLEGG